MRRRISALSAQGRHVGSGGLRDYLTGIAELDSECGESRIAWLTVRRVRESEEQKACEVEMRTPYVE